MRIKRLLYRFRYPSPYDKMLALLDEIENERATLVPRLERLVQGAGTEEDREEAMDELETVTGKYEMILTYAEEANLSTMDDDVRASIGSIRTMAENQQEVYSVIQSHVAESRVNELDAETIEALKPPSQ